MWTSGRGGSDWHRRMSPPENEFPAGVGFTALLGRTDDVAVGITQVEAFSTGFRFTMSVRVRQSRPDVAGGRLHMMVSGRGHPAIEVPLEDRLLLGLQYANGERTSTLERDPTSLLLMPHGGGGSDRSHDQTYWVSPLPPDGPVTFVVSWPSFGIPESRAEADGAAIRAAGARSQWLWEWEPEAETEPPPPPRRPDAGWFAEPNPS
ncbi:hypothetical protein ACQPZX_19780 [Actinoplanes sp. CA-142083]|uniref:hypothetical protein n=1 Tax=Actinoplanes sp. CA-142083 TaxID=3239903 RepID=UPI003D8C5A4A